MHRLNLIIKSIFDFISSIIGLIVVSPILLLIAILIKIDSKGPVFFTQKRIGYKGQPFKLIKFRTMIVNSEKIGDGIFLKSKNDKRVTKLGKFLRENSIDELPQLFNILKGDMSLVGPRPPLPYHPYEYNNYSNEQIKRFLMKPGVTGYAQIKYRNSVSWDERIVYDVEYVNNFNFWIDIKILFKTFLKIFKRESIYLNEKKKE